VEILVEPLQELLDGVADQVVIVGEQNAHSGHPKRWLI
jgi:hypothetical protein